MHTRQDQSLKLEDLPNIGKSIAADLRAIGILYPHQLTGREPLAIYNELSIVMGHRHDPCVLYTLISALHFLESGDALPWWKFSEQGRKLLDKMSGKQGNKGITYHMIQLKRVYEPPDSHDGRRFLVERLWPRGMKKESLVMEGWLKDAAPSDALRQWFGHDPAKWKGFQQRYSAELENNPAVLKPLMDAARQGTVTLLYSAHDQEHNNALALKNFLDERLAEKQGKK
jgi:uncharacterized protein YeaO (DUF488 family)